MAESSDKDFPLEITQDVYDRKLKYDKFKSFVQKQDPKYFDENPQFFLLFKDQLE